MALHPIEARSELSEGELVTTRLIRSSRDRAQQDPVSHIFGGRVVAKRNGERTFPELLITVACVSSSSV